jgi:hypothetical protein
VTPAELATAYAAAVDHLAAAEACRDELAQRVAALVAR